MTTNATPTDRLIEDLKNLVSICQVQGREHVPIYQTTLEEMIAALKDPVPGLSLPTGVVERLDDYRKRTGQSRAAVLADALLMLLMRDLRAENEELRDKLEEYENPT